MEQYFDTYWVCKDAWTVGLFAQGFGIVIPIPTTQTTLENMKIEANYKGEWVVLTNVETARFLGNLFVFATGLPEEEAGKCFLIRLNGTIK